MSNIWGPAPRKPKKVGILTPLHLYAQIPPFATPPSSLPLPRYGPQPVSIVAIFAEQSRFITVFPKL